MDKKNQFHIEKKNNTILFPYIDFNKFSLHI